MSFNESKLRDGKHTAVKLTALLVLAVAPGLEAFSQESLDVTHACEYYAEVEDDSLYLFAADEKIQQYVRDLLREKLGESVIR